MDTPRSTRPVRTLGALAVLALIGLAFYAGRHSGKPAPPAAPAATAPAPGAEAPTEFAPPPRSVPDGPLPALDRPLTQVVGDLDARSRRGERAASCRMALDADLCRRRDEYRDAVPFLENIAAARDDASGDIRFIARVENIGSRADAICAGLGEDWGEREAWRYMLRAALQGDTRMAVRFATDPPMDRGRMLEHPDAWQAYARYAPGLLLAAGERGDPAALYFLQQAYAGRPVLAGMREAIAPDPRKAAIYALALRGISDAATRTDLDGQLDALRKRFDAARWGEIEAEAQALSAKGLSARGPIDFDSGAFADVQPQDCATPG